MPGNKHYCFKCDWQTHRERAGWWSNSCKRCKAQKLEITPGLKARYSNKRVCDVVKELILYNQRPMSAEEIVMMLWSLDYYKDKRSAQNGLHGALRRLPMIESVDRGWYQYKK